MKKILLMTMMAAAGAVAWGEGAASTSAGVDISAANVVGIMPVKDADNFKVAVPVPFTAVGGGSAKLADLLCGDQLVTGNQVQMMMNGTSGYYTSWIWVNIPSVMSGLAESANVNAPLVSADSQAVPRGAGLFVNRSSKASTVWVMGEYPGETAVSLTLNSGTTSLIVNPTGHSVNLDQLSASFSGLDMIFVQDGTKEVAYNYSKTGKDGSHWYRTGTEYSYDETLKQLTSKNTQTYDLPVIGPGKSFRYYRGGLRALTLSF